MNVESFNLDHTRVVAPFVRIADRKRLPGGDELVKYDVRFCQTGFYALTLGLEPAEFLPLLEATFRDILTATEVPAANEVQCGWGANHSLEAAQAAVRDFLAARDEWSVVEIDMPSRD